MKFIRKKTAQPPLGLLTAAALLPGDWEIKVVDMNVESLRDEVIRWADIVFIGAMIIQKDSVRQIAARCHDLGKPVVGGGPLFTACPEDFSDLDYLVLNEAEITLPLFLKELASGNPRQIYSTDEKADVTLTPLPRWDLININLYAAMAVQYARGCPYDCEFCDNVYLNGRNPRIKTNEQMIREFDILYQMGWRGGIYIVAENFIGNQLTIKSLLKELNQWQRKRNYPFALTAAASMNIAQDKELMKMMTAAGFEAVFLGLETPDEKCLEECGKNQNRSMDMVDAVKTIQQNGLSIIGSFIIGFDSDPPDIFERQMKFIQNCGIAIAFVGLINASPGSRLYQRLKDEGRLLGNFSGDNCDGTMNFVPKMDPRILKEGYESVLNHIYSAREYYLTVLEFLNTYQPVKRRRITLLGITAFFNAIFYLGILDKWNNSVYFWRLLFRGLISYRKSLGEAVMLMIIGYHFRQLLK